MCDQPCVPRDRLFCAGDEILAWEVQGGATCLLCRVRFQWIRTCIIGDFGDYQEVATTARINVASCSGDA
jgi:hypothetical protein